MRFGVLVDGQMSKRRLVPRHRDFDRVIAEIDGWLRAGYPDLVRSTATTTTDDGVHRLAIDLHPAADPAELTATEDGRVSLSAATLAVGPGYERLVRRIVERLGIDFSIDWIPDPHDAAAGIVVDPSAPMAGSPAERAAVERTHLAWLGWALHQAVDGRRLGVGAVSLATPPGLRYSTDGALLTRLGPRDDAWLERALAEPRVAIDVWPWWADATDARSIFERALSLMWTEVRWRGAGDPDEGRIQDEVLRLFRRAYPLDPGLPYPWREWRDLLHSRNVDDPQVRVVFERARQVDPTVPFIGYRRLPVTVEQGGWSLEVPGSFAERRTDEEWWGGEAGRSITLAGIVTGEPGRPMGADAFLQQVAANLGSDVLEHREGPKVGRAHLGVADESGIQVAILDGFMAVPGRGAAVRIVIHDASDWEWAIEMWRALVPAPSQTRDRIEVPAPTAVLDGPSDGAAAATVATTRQSPASIGRTDGAEGPAHRLRRPSLAGRGR